MSATNNYKVTVLYRYRKCNEFLFEELEKSEIYFSDLKSLNDPMDGYRSIHFCGSKGDWSNFFKNYIWCLYENIINRVNNDCYNKKIAICTTLKHLNEINLKKFNKLSSAFASSDFITDVISSLENTMLMGTELFRIMKICHPIAIQFILENIKPETKAKLPRLEDGFLSVKERLEAINSQIILKNKAMDTFGRLACQKDNECVAGMFLDREIFNPMNIHGSPLLSIEQIKFLYIDFPQYFLKECENIIFNSFRIACFCSEYNNSAMWAHYADSHKGVCLIFGSVDNNFFIEQDKLPTYEVKYEHKLLQHNFFSLITQLNKKITAKLWKKEKSIYIFATTKNNPIIDNVLKSLTTKSPEWEYEKETRLIIQNSDNLPKRVYPFEALVGIIFGINTAISDKQKIVKIIRNKCEKHKITFSKFKFYQAYQDYTYGTVRIRECCKFNND